MAKPVKAKSITRKEVVLSGSLSLSSAADNRKQLLQALDEADTVQLILQEVEDVDLSLVQIICAAHRSAIQRDKLLELQNDLPDIFTQIIEDAGLHSHIGCTSDKRGCCIWLSR